ncbi:MAG: alpha-ketoacid dehydrogenase subunit beta [Nitrososphaerota archaeon]
MAEVGMAKALNMALREEMRRDSRVVVLGEDVGVRGGVFLVTEGLLDEFGPERVLDTPLSELGIVGMAVGMAMYGLKPVAEIQFIDFAFPAADQLFNHLPFLRYRSGGENIAPVVVRAPCGSGVRGGFYHSQSPEALYLHRPGLKVVIPSSPYDAKGLLKAAIRDEDPVIFLEPKLLYRTPREEVPEEEYIVPLGKAKKVREGEHVTILTYGWPVHESAKAADEAAKEGIGVEVLDLRTLMPLDIEAILQSVKKTGRVVIVHDAPRTMGFGAELGALIAERALEHLRAPIKRVTGPSVPQAPNAFEELYNPTSRRILWAIRQLMRYG